MPFIFQRPYQSGAAAPTTTNTPSSSSMDTAGAAKPNNRIEEPAVQAPSLAPDAHTTTRVCHSWSYYDASTDETILVVLHAHHSLHVDVSGESFAGAPHNTGASATTNAAMSSPKGISEISHEGLCGYTWELAWLPSPSSSSPSASSTTSAPAAAAVRGCFYFPRSRPLASSTLHGSGGVLFCSSRHVLILTEAAASPTASTSSALAGPTVDIDSFVVRAVSDAHAGRTPLWQRAASAVRLPCGPPQPMSPSRPAAPPHLTPLLVSGVLVSTNGAGVADPLRVVYVAAMAQEASALPLSSSKTSGAAAEETVECIFVGVADLCASSADGGALTCVPRHAVTETVVPLRLSRPLRMAAAAPPLDLHVRDLLWVYVADSGRNRIAAAHGTQLYGSLVAVLPCLLENGTGAALTGAAASSVPLLQLPAIPCSGFHAASRYGVLGVAGDALDSLALQETRRQQQQQQRGEARAAADGGASAADAEEILAQLLPAAERSVYEVELGPPADHLLSSVSSPAADAQQPRQLPPHTSVLMFVCDGLSTCAPSSAQGLFTTQTPSWQEVAASAAAAAATGDGGPTHRLPLSRTLWCDLSPVVPSRAGHLLTPAPPSDGRNMFTCALTEWKWWAAQLRDVDGVAASVPGASGYVDQGGDVAASSLSAAATATRTTTSVPFFSSAHDTVAWCLPVPNALTQEMMVWYVVHEATANSLPPTGGPAAVASLPPLLGRGEKETEGEWEAQVAEWVVSRHLLSSSTTVKSDAADEAALTSTYAVLKLLWAYAAHHTTTTKSSIAPQPAWVSVLLDVLHSTADEAQQPQMRLHVYAHALPSLVSAGLLSHTTTPTPASMEAEVAHMRRTAATFLRLVLRVLVELDWHAGDAQGRRCCQWMAHWFLGGAAASVHGESCSDAGGDADTCVEGRAMQVLLQLGSSEHTLAWLRRMVLLYSSRCRTRPLELTLSDIVEAAGVSLDASSPQQQRSEADVVEWRASMEYALLRMVRPGTLHDLLHALASTTGRQSFPSPTAQHKNVVLRGLLSLADLHALVCVGWAPALVQEAAPLGFSFVCLLVDVALRAASDSAEHHSQSESAERYEQLVSASLDTWELGRGGDDIAGDVRSHGELAPVYPLLSLLGGVQVPQCTVGDANAPFPFSLLPPLLTVYVWYHTADRLCTALRFLPGQTAAATTDPSGAYGDEAESTPWWRRGQRDRDVLRSLHRATCVLRCLTQDSPICAAELFAATQLAAVSDAGAYDSSSDHEGEVAVENSAAATTTSSTTGKRSWGTQHLLAWQQLLPLTAPPLSTPGAIESYQEHCQATMPHLAYLLRVLHFVYASAGGGHLLRAQLWRATWGSGGRHGVAEKEAGEDTVHTRSVRQLEESLQAWMAEGRLNTAKPSSASASAAAAEQLLIKADTIAPWLLQVWAHVLLCDPTAVTDVAIYEQLYAALAHVRQKANTSSSVPQRLSLSGADVGLALLRPCLMYAYPLLRQLAVAEEMLSEDHAAVAASLPRFPQFNVPLAWGSDAVVPQTRASAVEQLCAGEVCERARRQLNRLIALYEVPSNGGTRSSGSSSGGDVRFRVLGLLLSLLPPARDLAQRQRRLARCTGSSSGDAITHSARGTPAADDAQRARSSSSDEDFSEETPSEGSEAAVDLAHFFLSPSAAYAVAVAAPAVGGGGASTSSPSSHAAHASRHLGWLTVVCEVLRRELRASVAAELVTTHCVLSNEGETDSVLVATEAELKRFINALADAVEPLTDALVTGLAAPLFRSLVLLLVFDTLYALLAADTQTDVGVAAAAPFIRADAQLLRLVRRWILKVVIPLYRSLAVEDRKAVTYVVTSAFAETFFNTAGEEEKASDEAVQMPARYVDSKVHQAWQQWRRQGSPATAAAPWSAMDAAVLRCLEACVGAEHRHLLHVAPPFGAPPIEQHTQQPHQQPQPGGASAVSWREAGSALRSSLIQSIGATVAPRNTATSGVRQQETSSSSRSMTPSPQPPAVAPGGKAAPSSASLAPLHGLPGQERGGVAAGVVPQPATRDADEAAQLLVKEEAFLRRQLTQQLLSAQQRDVFASAPFQHALVDLYVAMRAEKRRKELVAFALDQLDLIFAFASREHHQLLEESRRGLRQAWVEYGERQRLALRRLLQEERDDRMGVQALAHADRAALREAQQAEHKVWFLQAEGRLGVQLQEQDAWDGIAVAAAQAQVELARRAVEQEEAAYWAAEDEAWERMEGTEESASASAPAAPNPLPPVLRPAPLLPTAPSQYTDKAAVVKAVSEPAASLPEARTDFTHTAASTAAAAAAAAGATSSSLFGTLARWQTVLRDTVAPAPPTKHTAQSTTAPPASHQPAATKAAAKDDDWGWDSEEEEAEAEKRSENTQRPAPVVAGGGAGRVGGTAVAAPPPTSLQAHQPLVTAPVVSLASRRVVPLTRGSTANPSAHAPKAEGTEGASVVPLAASGKSTRARKGLAAAVLVEPVSTAAPPLPPQPPALIAPRAEALPALSERAPNHDDATPNPVRSILSAVEAAAMETISKVREALPSPPPSRSPSSPTTTPTRRSVTHERNAQEEAAASLPLAATSQVNDSAKAKAAATAAESGDGWGWSEEDEEGGEEEQVPKPQSLIDTVQDVHTVVAAVVPVQPPTAEPRAPEDSGVAEAVPQVEEASQNGWGWEEDEDKASEEETGVIHASAIPHECDPLDAGERAEAPGCGTLEPPVVALAEEPVVEASVEGATHEGDASAHVAATVSSGQQQEQQLSAVLEPNDVDDGWGWSDDDDDDDEAAALSVLPNPSHDAARQPLVLSPPTMEEGSTPALAASAPSNAVAAEPNNAQELEDVAGRDGWSEEDEGGSFGSDVVLQPITTTTTAGTAASTATTPMTASSPSAAPHRTFDGRSDRTDLRLQQLYLSELEVREEMLNFL